MRVPGNPENWTPRHADRAVDSAWRQFARYENRIDFEAPQEAQEKTYHPYRMARELAITIARYTGWRAREAEMLP